MKWWHRRRSVQRVNRATNANEAPQTSSKTVVKSCALRGTASSTPRHTAYLDIYHAGMGLLPLTCDGGVGAWPVGALFSLSCASNARACVCGRLFSRRKKRAGHNFLPSLKPISKGGGSTSFDGTGPTAHQKQLCVSAVIG